MGIPEESLRQCPLALDKWMDLKVGHEVTLLGLCFNSRNMTVGMTMDYLDETIAIIDASFHKNRKSFTVHEIELLVGKLGRLGKGAAWVYQLMTHIYSSIANALCQNKSFLSQSSHEFRSMMKLDPSSHLDSIEQEVMEINFAIKQMTKNQQKCTQKLFISKTLGEEI